MLHASCWDYFIHAGCKRHITPQGAGVATGPVKFVVEALRRLDWTWEQVEDWTVCTYVGICGGCLGICAYVVQREPTPGGPGSGWRRGRKRFLCQLPPWFYVLYVAHREPTPGGPGSGLRPGRKRFLCQLPL